MTDESVPEALEDIDQETAKNYAGDVFNRQAVAVFEDLCQVMDKNEALGVTITALSEALGCMISLVKEDHQEEVIVTANLVVKQGLALQTELVAQMAYGHIGHA